MARITCGRCGRDKRVETLGIEHVMGLCIDCFKWMLQARKGGK